MYYDFDIERLNEEKIKELVVKITKKLSEDNVPIFINFLQNITPDTRMLNDIYLVIQMDKETFSKYQDQIYTAINNSICEDYQDLNFFAIFLETIAIARKLVDDEENYFEITEFLDTLLDKYENLLPNKTLTLTKN